MRAAAALASVGLLGACGFDGASGELVDASIDAPIDAPLVVIDTAPDANLGAWGAPLTLSELAGDGSDDDPSLTSDLLTMYFGSTRTGGSGFEDIWMVTRASIGDAWNTAVAVTELNSIAVESNVEISGDGLTLTFTSNRMGTFDLYQSRRAVISDPWPTPTPIMGVKSGLSSEYGGQLVDGGLGIYFCSNRGLDEKIYFAQRNNLAMPFMNSIVVAGIDTPSNECDVWRVGETLYFTRDTGVVPPRDIYAADRKPAAPLDYLEPQLVGPDISLASDDSDPWVSADQRFMFFASDRANGLTSAIYMSVR